MQLCSAIVSLQDRSEGDGDSGTASVKVIPSCKCLGQGPSFNITVVCKCLGQGPSFNITVGCKCLGQGPSFNITVVCKCLGQGPSLIITVVCKCLGQGPSFNKLLLFVSVWVRVPPSMLLWSETFLGKFWRFLETTQSDLSVQHHSLMCSHVTCLHRLQLRRLGGLWRV